MGYGFQPPSIHKIFTHYIHTPNTYDLFLFSFCFCSVLFFIFLQQIRSPIKKSKSSTSYNFTHILFGYICLDTHFIHSLKPAEFTSDIYLPALIPMPSCNCRSCKPSLYQTHANQSHLNHHRYHRQAVPAISTDIPSIPPQPNRIDYERRFDASSVDVPLPPPRRYQVVPIQNSGQPNQTNNNDPPNMVSFVKSMCERDTPQRSVSGQSRVASRPIVIKDPRRKPYYYNELDQNSNDTEEISNMEPNSGSVNELPGKFNSIRGSGGSLNNII